MISSIDTYVYNQFKNTLDVILDNEYIVDNALARLDKEARDNFKRTYTGKGRKEILMSYQFPLAKEAFDARIVIQMGPGVLEEGSIGNVEGTFTYRELGHVKEVVEVVELAPDENGRGRIGFELQHEIGEIDSIEEIEFAVRDQVREEGNILSFSGENRYDLLGMRLTVHYYAKQSKEGKEDPMGVKAGFTFKETVEVTPLSSNMDTARCLDAIIKVALIIMLESREEKDEYLLQVPKFEAMQVIIPEEQDRPVFGRPLTLLYTVSHNLDLDYLAPLKEINIRGYKGGI